MSPAKSRGPLRFRDLPDGTKQLMAEAYAAGFTDRMVADEILQGLVGTSTVRAWRRGNRDLQHARMKALMDALVAVRDGGEGWRAKEAWLKKAAPLHMNSIPSIKAALVQLAADAGIPLTNLLEQIREAEADQG